jgi:hypothetical protein
MVSDPLTASFVIWARQTTRVPVNVLLPSAPLAKFATDVPGGREGTDSTKGPL